MSELSESHDFVMKYYDVAFARYKVNFRLEAKDATEDKFMKFMIAMYLMRESERVQVEEKVESFMDDLILDQQCKGAVPQ